MRDVKWMCVMVLIVGLSSVVWAAGDQLDVHDGSAITITSPQNGDSVGSSFPLTYTLRKGLKADHAHAYVDGKYQKGFKGTISNVSPGRHTVTVKVATDHHDTIAVADSVEVIVK